MALTWPETKLHPDTAPETSRGQFDEWRYSAEGTYCSSKEDSGIESKQFTGVKRQNNEMELMRTAACRDRKFWYLIPGIEMDCGETNMCVLQ